MNSKEEKCTVIENRQLQKNYFLMKLKADYIASQCRAGHFIMLAASRSYDPLLKRPFGILRAEPPYIWLYYETVGRGTELISSLKAGDEVDAIGPLGNAFPEFTGKRILMVAGGRGIVPLYFAIETLGPSNDVFLVHGVRTKEDFNLQDEIKRLPLKNTYLYSDDGSFEKKGFVTTDIRDIITSNRIEITFSCGPDAMFENLFHTISGMNTENYVSLEALMGCGIGICYSCVVKMVTGHYKKVCSDGPIFKMEDIAW